MRNRCSPAELLPQVPGYRESNPSFFRQVTTLLVGCSRYGLPSSGGSDGPSLCRQTPDIFGGAAGNRTPDLLSARQTLFQLSYSPKARWVGWQPPTLAQTICGGWPAPQSHPLFSFQGSDCPQKRTDPRVLLRSSPRGERDPKTRKAGLPFFGWPGFLFPFQVGVRSWATPSDRNPGLRRRG